MGNFAYLCVEMSWKGLISRMADECLITQETVFPYCYDCQAVMRKFTLAGKTASEKGMKSSNDSLECLRAKFCNAGTYPDEGWTIRSKLS